LAFFFLSFKEGKKGNLEFKNFQFHCSTYSLSFWLWDLPQTTQRQQYQHLFNASIVPKQCRNLGRAFYAVNVNYSSN